MFERIKDCICHPRFIGKYNKDHAGIVFITILFFLMLCLAVLAARSYTTPAFTEDTNLMFVSNIIQNGEKETGYSVESHKITGESFEVSGQGYVLVVLPKEDNANLKMNTITIVLKESEAVVYYSGISVSTKVYSEINCSNFSFKNISSNQPTDTYYFKLFLDGILDSSKVFFQTLSFLQEASSIIIYYLICVVFCYVLSLGLNPTITRGVRAKFCFYDACVYFIGSFFAYLFNFGLLIYFSLVLPLIYTFITFRHVVRVVITK